MTVQRQTAASRSASPSSNVQHGVIGGFPTTKPTNPPIKSAQTPSFRVSLGQVCLGTNGGGGHGFGIGFGFGFGFGFGIGGFEQLPHPETKTKKRRLIERNSANAAVLPMA